MKKSMRKIAILLCLVCLTVAMLALVACNKDGYTVTLDANGGNLYRSTVAVAKDASILEAVGDIVPKADGLVFDTWLLNGQPLTADDKMTGDVTLIASYKTAYRVEVYFESADKTGYVKDDAKTVSGYGKVGESISPSISGTDGYALNRELSTDVNKALVVGENLYKYYYTRADRKITYVNLGDEGEVSADVPTYTGAREVLADCMFERPGYTFIGWSDGISVGTEDKYLSGRTIEISGDITLYAQWGIEYTDAYRSGASVIIAELASSNNSIGALYASADGNKALGSFDGITEFFTAGSVKGKVDDEAGQFIYDATGTYVGYSLLGNATDEKYGTITLDALTGEATYSVNDSSVKGVYEELRLQDGRFTGEKQFVSNDESFYFTFLEPTDNPTYDTAKFNGEFFRRGEEAGRYVVVDMSGGKFDVPYKYTIELDGYGNLDFYVPALNAVLGAEIAVAYGTYTGYDEQTGEWYFEYEGQLFEDTNNYPRELVFKVGHIKTIVGTTLSSGDVEGEIIDDIPVIIYKNENIEGVYEDKATGAKLEMDGYGNAVYTANSTAEAIEGYAAYKGIANNGTELKDFSKEDCAAEGAEAGMEFSTLRHFWEYENNKKAVEFTYFDGSDNEQSVTILCLDRASKIKDRWDDDFEIVKEADKLFAGTDNSNSAGSYRIAHGEEDFIDMQLNDLYIKADESDPDPQDNVKTAKLMRYDTSAKTSIWFATGEYVMTSATEGEFTLTEASQSVAYLGVAIGNFKFRLTEVDGMLSFDIYDSTFDGFTMNGITVDGYDKLTDGGVEYKYEKLDNGMIKATDSVGNTVMYYVDYSNKTVTKSQPEMLVGEYLTVVKDNALYIGPGKLLFDGNGKAKFYEMSYGNYIGEGTYIYDASTNRGSFITSCDIQFFVESFEFCIDTMTDIDGITYNVYLKYDKNQYSEMMDDYDNTLTLDGFGNAIYTYDEGASSIKSRYTIEEIVFSGMSVGSKIVFEDTNDMFFAMVNDGYFVKEVALGTYFGVFYSEEDVSFMLDESSMLLLLGEGNGNMGQVGELLNPDAEDIVEIGYTVDDEEEGILSLFTYDEDYNEVPLKTIKLIKLPAYDEFNGQYFVDAYVTYSAETEATYNNADGSSIVIDGYGDAVYTDKDGEVFEIPFYNVQYADDMLYLGIEDERFPVPSQMLTAKLNGVDNTFTTANEVGTYARLKDDDFYFPYINLYSYDADLDADAFLIYATQIIDEEMYTIIYAQGTYTQVVGEDGVFELTITGITEYFDDIAELFVPNQAFRIKLTRVSNSNGDYASYILLDEEAKGEYTFEDKTYTLDGFGAVTTNDGQTGTASRVGDALIIEIGDDTLYYTVGDDNVLTVAEYIVYIEFIK